MIRFQYNPVFKDYRALNRYVLFRGRRLVAWVAIFAGMLMVLTTTVVNSPDEMKTAEGMVALLKVAIGCALFFVILFAFFYWRVRRRWNAAEELRTPRDYEMDDAGIRVKGELFQGSMEWKLFKTADFSRGYAFLKTGQNLYYYFPISAFPDQKAFLELVNRHVKVSKRWERALLKTGAA
ncbi:MAG TPA: hypothetical protein VG733_01925 [Chthoniobacteraceae bacterium]|nr:hypothetical protein [Chthoniobacteraceae bacterium]